MPRDRRLAFRPWPSGAKPRSLWVEQALEGEPPAAVQRLQGTERADVCIIGGGFSGLWTALRIKELEPAADVAVLEADLCGAGASGRNGGIVVGWWWKLPALLGLAGRDEARRLLDGSLRGITDVEDFCRDHAPDAAFRRAGWYWTATTELQRDAWRPTTEAISAMGLAPWEAFSGAELAARLGSPLQLEGVLDASAGIVQPAALARGLRRVLLDRGVRIFEQSPVATVDSGNPVVCRTPEGQVRADRVVLAMNAWMADLPDFRKRVFTVSSDVVATEPLGDRLEEIGWTGDESWSDSQLRVRYARTTSDGRIALGRGGGTLAYRSRMGAAFDRSASLADEVADDLRALYPGLGSARITHRWAGPVERAVHGLPAFGALGGDPRLLFAIGYSGTGVAPAALGGRVLASLACERQDEWSSMSEPLCRALSAGSLPPEPIRYVGGRVIQAAVARRERAESRGRTPSRVDRYLTGLVPKPVE